MQVFEANKHRVQQKKQQKKRQHKKHYMANESSIHLVSDTEVQLKLIVLLLA